MKYQTILDEAFEAMEVAYAPYSKYLVGACVLCKDGRTFRGVNVENASYGATNCAERTAIFATYAYGYRKDDENASAHCFAYSSRKPQRFCLRVYDLVPEPSC